MINVVHNFCQALKPYEQKFSESQLQLTFLTTNAKSGSPWALLLSEITAMYKRPSLGCENTRLLDLIRKIKAAFLEEQNVITLKCALPKNVTSFGDLSLLGG
ncbi:hypothetical protein NPIL_112641 [Nephila pilipes]|uniref:Uncharacterized protein n=1 Tax=Nephila pilipes TaxID=299642 RepID=A0A8X6MX17_NEPPI|nr:hypothetical protein NPIL_112641 [Nephila pilipes]